MKVTKQETLGEAAKKYFKNNGSNISFFDAVFFGAKWQQEQDKNKYSEKDMIKAIYFGAGGMYGYQIGEEGYDVNQIKRFLETLKNK